MNGADALGGQLLLRPGQPRPGNLGSSRVDWAAVLARGQPAASLPGTLACLYTLCGQAHRLCASMAIAAAQGQAAAQRGPVPRELVRETMREHLRRICLDWPATLGCDAGDGPAGALGRCPLFGNDDPAATLRWVEQALLAMPAAHWLARWQNDPADWLARWSGAAATPTARWLAGCRPLASQVLASTPLRVHADDACLLLLAADLLADAGFSRKPLWRAACAETGPAARLQDQRALPASPWLRLGARLAELVTLVELSSGRSEFGHGSPPLMCGSVPTGPGEGLAWVEMARGLLVHVVRLDGRGPRARVAACRVLAPTEWNFHPQGVVAQYLENMVAAPSPSELQRLRLLIAAYDPCVRFEVGPARSAEPCNAQEQDHA